MVGYIWGQMDEQIKHRLVGRVRRIRGQVQALEVLLETDKSEQFIMQLRAAVAGLRSLLATYADAEILDGETISPSQKALLRQLLEKAG